MYADLRYLVACVSIMATLAYAENPSKIDAPDIKVGDRWVYNEIDLYKKEKTGTMTLQVVSKSRDEVRATVTTASGTREDVFDGEWNSRIRDGRTYTPFYPSYAFPLEVGKTWTAKVTYPNRTRDGENRVETTGIVVGWESITVPAGTFNALKIRHDGRWQNVRTLKTNSGISTTTIWYVPEVRRYVKYEYDDGYNKEGNELAEYKLN
jgi:hypothetical protein